MTGSQIQKPYWAKWSASESNSDPGAAGPRLPPGEDLTALRRGAGRPAGSVPQMWQFYTAGDTGGVEPSADLTAEHIGLVLFGFHQQSENRLMHSPSRKFARALRDLRGSERFHDREPALDAKVAAAATATSIGELGWHLRGLVALLKDADISFDYSSLVADLATWQHPTGQARVRRRWGRDYYSWGTKTETPTKSQPTVKDSTDA